MSVFGRVQKSFAAGFLRKLFRVKIINPENEPKDITTSYIVCINHSSNWDPIVIGACTKRPLRYMAKAELFKVPVLKSIVKLFGAYPVNRDSADVSAIRTTINILEKGETVGMFPQGHRAKRINPNKIVPKNSVAMIAMKAKSGVLPVTVITKGYKVRIFHKTIVVFGRYIPFEEFEEFQKIREIKDGEISGIKDRKDISENMNLYKKITDKIYGEMMSNYSKYDTLNKI
ncbi:MAG: 1-acyl-sn-glycerol-3-phosphate acyltransferase [Oscillospiraceae bacterium]|nr:1-acyl-sn-glycerol-3-phosphate acyltransferase [Oscillospiraceae bacterium]